MSPETDDSEPSRIDQLVQLFHDLSRKREAATDRNGFLSYAGEFHALAIGLAIGAYAGINWQPALVATFLAVTFGLQGAGKLERVLRTIGKASEASTVLGELRREPWYGAGGLLIAFTGTALAVHGPARLFDLATSLL